MKQNQFVPGDGKSDPLIWGAWGALVGGIAGISAMAFDAMPETQSVGGLVGGGFLMLSIAASMKNWLASRR